MTATFRDLSAFIAALEEAGQLRTVLGADPHLEIGTIVELNHEHDGPALLFDDIPGYPSGYRILCNAMEVRPGRRWYVVSVVPSERARQVAVLSSGSASARYGWVTSCSSL